MKTLFIFLLLPAFIVKAPSFEKMMDPAMKSYYKAESVEEMLQVADRFATIKDAYPNEWTPAYYEALLLVSASFDVNDAKQRLALLERSKPIIKALEQKWPNEHEIHTLHSLYYCAALVADMRRAPELSPMIQVSAGKALEIAPNNPRAHYLKISNNMGKASYFGQDVSAYCLQAQEALLSFDTFQSETPYAPVWGKDLLQGLTQSCKDSTTP